MEENQLSCTTLKNEVAHKNALAFLLGGKCTFTILTDEPKSKSLDHITMRITERLKHRIWSVWYGHEQVATIIMKSTGFTVDFNKENFFTPMHEIAAKSIEFVVRRLQLTTLPPKVHILHEGMCGKCGRPLTDPVSIEYGLGPICRGEKQ